MSSLEGRANVLVNSRRVRNERKKPKCYYPKVVGIVLLAILSILVITAISMSYSLKIALSKSCALYSADKECIENNYIGAVWYKLRNNAFLYSYMCSNVIFFRTWSPASASVRVHVFSGMNEEKTFALEPVGNGYWATKQCLENQEIRYYYEYVKGKETVKFPDLNSPFLYAVNSTSADVVDHYETVLPNDTYQFGSNDHVTLHPDERNVFYMVDLQSYVGVEDEIGYHVAFYESEYFNTIGVTAMILGNVELRVCEDPNCWKHPSFHPGVFDPKYGSLTALQSSIDRVHQRGVAVLLEVRWDFFAGLSPIGLYQAFNEASTTQDSRLATLVEPSSEGEEGRCSGYRTFSLDGVSAVHRAHDGSTQQPHPYAQSDGEDDDRIGDTSGKESTSNSTSRRSYCMGHNQGVLNGLDRTRYTLNLRRDSPARILLRELFQTLYEDYHIDGLYWSESGCDGGIGSDGCVNGNSTELERQLMEELMEEARTIGLVQVSAMPMLHKSDFIIDYSLYHYITDTYANTNHTVDIESLVNYMQTLPSNYVWALEGPYSASNRLINQLTWDQYTAVKTTMMFFSRNLFLFMGSDFDYPVDFSFPFKPVDYYNLIGLYYNNDNPGWTGGRNYTDILISMQHAYRFMVDRHWYSKREATADTTTIEPLMGCSLFAFCENGLFVMTRFCEDDRSLMVFNNAKTSRDIQFALPYSFFFNTTMAEYNLPIRLKVIYDEIRSLSPKLLGIGCDGITQIDIRWFFEPDPSASYSPPLGPTINVAVADHLCYYVSLKRLEYTYFVPMEMKVVKPEELGNV